MSAFALRSLKAVRLLSANGGRLTTSRTRSDLGRVRPTTRPTEELMLTTRFTKLVGCSVPIQQAGMGAAAPPELACAVSEAGGLGMIGTARAGITEIKLPQAGAAD